jgi:hypothetical protein
VSQGSFFDCICLISKFILFLVRVSRLDQILWFHSPLFA